MEEIPQSDRYAATRWHLVWFGVFAANLPLPVLLGYELGHNVRLGMITGVAVWLLLSHLLFHRVERLRGVMIWGGICVALSQVGVILHVLAGIAAASIVLFLGVQGGTFAVGFWLTVLTGGLLMSAAVICGRPVWGVIRFCREAS
jgi:hypothetical protein